MTEWGAGMSRGHRDVHVAVVGAPDLLRTSVVEALRAHGYPTVLVPRPRVGPDVVDRGRPGVLVVDVGPADAVPAIEHATSAGWTVVALGATDEREQAAAAVVAGAEAMICKDAPFDELAAAVCAGVAGALRMTGKRRDEWAQVHRGVQRARAAQVERLRRLSRREVEVLRRLVDGERAADVATGLFVSLATVRTHIRSILTKLEVNSQEQAVAVLRDGAGH